jgi:hypothetical protein
MAWQEASSASYDKKVSLQKLPCHTNKTQAMPLWVPFYQ